MAAPAAPGVRRWRCPAGRVCTSCRLLLRLSMSDIEEIVDEEEDFEDDVNSSVSSFRLPPLLPLQGPQGRGGPRGARAGQGACRS